MHINHLDIDRIAGSVVATGFSTTMGFIFSAYGASVGTNIVATSMTGDKNLTVTKT